MKLSKALRKAREEAAKSPEFWMERAKLDFSVVLESQRRRHKISYRQIATDLKLSPAYISKVFRGDSNLTIKTMVKLASAVGGQLEVRVVKKSADVTVLEGEK